MAAAAPTGFVTLSDGVSIAVNVRMPTNYVTGQRYPTVFEMSGYDGAAQSTTHKASTRFPRRLLDIGQAHAPPFVDSYYAYVQRSGPGVNTVLRGPDTPSRIMLPMVPLQGVQLGPPLPCGVQEAARRVAQPGCGAATFSICVVDIDLRAPRPDEADDVFAICSETFTSPPERGKAWMATKRMEDFLGAWAGEELVATTEVMPVGQFFGRRSVPMGGVASVAVRPDHRGRGIAPRLLGMAMERMHEEGLVISTLHPATTRFYRGLGWEIGGEFGVRRVPCASLAALPPGEPECLRREGAGDFDAVRECYERVATGITGAVDRSDALWRVYEHALDHQHRYRYVYEVDGRVDGYVVYDQLQAGRQWGFRITVHELVAADARAAVTLWRHIGSHAAQVDTVTVLAMPLDALTLLLPEQVIELVGANHWMTRIVDAAGAIAARGYPPGVRGEVHLLLADRLSPWNDGRFVLRVEGGEGKLSPGGTGDVHLSINALASVYTGWASARVLAHAGLIHHAGDRELGMLDAAFAGPRPYLFDNF